LFVNNILKYPSLSEGEGQGGVGKNYSKSLPPPAPSFVRRGITSPLPSPSLRQAQGRRKEREFR